MLTALGMAAVSLATPFASPRIFDKWFVLPEMLYLSPLPILSAVLFLGLWWQTFHLPKPDDRHALLPFLTLALIFVLGFAGLAWSFYPFVVPDRLTIWQAAQRHRKPRRHPGRHGLRAADHHLRLDLRLPGLRRQGDGSDATIEIGAALLRRLIRGEGGRRPDEGRRCVRCLSATFVSRHE